MGLKVYSAGEGNMSLKERYYLASDVDALLERLRGLADSLRESGEFARKTAKATKDEPISGEFLALERAYKGVAYELERAMEGE